jgi:hypothetical protein
MEQATAMDFYQYGGDYNFHEEIVAFQISKACALTIAD